MAVASIVYFHKVLEILESSPELKRSVVGMAKQAGWAAGGTIAGACVAGPPGAFIGAVAGAWMGFSTADDYKSMISVLRGLSEDEKYRVQMKIQQLVGSAAIEDFVLYIQNEVNRVLLMNTLKDAASSRHGG